MIILYQGKVLNVSVRLLLARYSIEEKRVSDKIRELMSACSQEASAFCKKLCLTCKKMRPLRSSGGYRVATDPALCELSCKKQILR